MPMNHYDNLGMLLVRCDITAYHAVPYQHVIDRSQATAYYIENELDYLFNNYYYYNDYIQNWINECKKECNLNVILCFMSDLHTHKQVLWQYFVYKCGSLFATALDWLYITGCS